MTAATRRPRRWHRLAIPLGLAGAVLLTTGITYAVEQPDTADPAYLSPVSAAPTGGQRLADRVRAAGVSVQRETRTSDALVAAYRGDATLLVTVPGVVQPAYLRMLSLLPASTRVVLVAPGAGELAAGALPVRAAGRRWAAAARGPDFAVPGCALPEARRAGVAAALRTRYAVRPAAAGHRCYGDGLVTARWYATELVLVGADDPFRNDRIGEHGNAELAAGLLSTRPRLVWLDVHRVEPPPKVDPHATPAPDGRGVPPSLAPGGGSDTDAPGDGRPGGQDPPRRAAQSSESPLWGAFPAWFWALLAQLGLAALLLALWRARRLGPPVPEPLPVAVPAGETVLGRARLYRRVRARDRAAQRVRDMAGARLADQLAVPAGDRAGLVDAVAGATGVPAEQVAELLYGPAPENDEELVRLAGQLAGLRPAHPGGPAVR
ncbi:MAG TPA: DUF4350 domain-containing protein [Pilimelia sp.]|nr:DUF4350 domain-containing protein [Pilimelia sp.]